MISKNKSRGHGILIPILLAVTVLSSCVTIWALYFRQSDPVLAPDYAPVSEEKHAQAIPDDSAGADTFTYLEIVGNGSSENSRVNIRTLDYNGNEWIGGTLTQASDNRLKTEDGEVPDLSGIKARAFHWNAKKQRHDDKLHLGYFAQDVEAIAPYLVDEDAMGYKSLDYNAVFVAKIAALEKRIAELERRINTCR